MRKLTDVYIKVTKQNQEELSKITCVGNLPIGEYLIYYDDVLSSFEFENENGVDGLKKVSLSELKRLIDTIPTREEITRLKRQISAYKTNYDKVVKHSLSKEDELEFFRIENESLRNIILTLELTNDHLYDKKDTLQKENEKLKHDVKKVRCERDSLNVSFKNFNEMYDNALKKLDIQADLIRDKNAQLEQLKQRKWWHIWK